MRKSLVLVLTLAVLTLALPAMADSGPDGPFSLTRLWRPLAEAGRIGGVVLDGFWMHVGDPAAREAAEARLAAEPAG